MEIPSLGTTACLSITNTGAQFAGPIIVTFYNNYAYILSNDDRSIINVLYIISGNQLSTCPISASTGAIGSCSVSNVVGNWSQILAFNNVIYLASNGSSSYINYCDTSLTSCQPTGPNISLYDLGGNARIMS